MFQIIFVITIFKSFPYVELDWLYNNALNVGFEIVEHFVKSF